MRRFNWMVSAALAGIAAFAVAGCASEGDIDRTQPGRVSKAIFTGEWYYRQFVTDVPATTAYDMIGSQGDMDRIKWRITENALVAYRSYANLPGSENKWTEGGNNETAPMAAFTIVSHFDVKRSYNTATGEQTNVIYEDSSDRPWYEREYMRVDWTRNALPTLRALTATYYGVTPESYVPEIEGRIDPDRALITANYIDVSTRFFVDEQACSAYDTDSYDTYYRRCTPASIKVRSSFLKIDKANNQWLAIDDNNKQTYEPLEYRDGVLLKDDAGKLIPAIALNDGQHPCEEGIAALGGPSSGYTREEDCTPARVGMFEKFGFFRTEYATYDRDFDLTESGRVYLAKRHNIWKGSIKDAAGAPIPVAQRQTRPVTYYLNTQYPEDMFHTAQILGADYNKAFKDTVAGMILNEENAGAGATAEEIRARAETLPEIFFVKQNSCNLKTFTVDPNAPEFANKDLSFVPTITTREWANAHPTAKAAALKLMARAGEPLKDDLSELTEQNVERFCTALEDATLGEDRAEDRFVWQRIGDLRFSFINYIVRDQLAGPLGYGPSDADPMTGEIINVNANLYGAGLDQYAASAVEMVQVLNGDILLADLLQGQDILNAVAANTQRAKAQNERPIDPVQYNKLIAALPSHEDLLQLKSMAPGYLQRRMELIKGTELENKLVNEDIAMLDPGYRPGQAITREIMERVSPATRRNPASNRNKRWERAMNFKEHDTCMYLAEFADDSIIGWAMEMKGRNMTREQMLVKARADILLGLAEHEVGHTVGLRHNFEGSTDALNYFDDFWLIRKQFPKAEWPAHRLSEYGYSTVMDYGAKFNTDIQGLGKYDFAAIKFGYGQLVETFPTAAVATAGDVLDNQLFVGNYESIPQIFRNNIDNVKMRVTVPYQQVVDQVRSTLLANRPVNTREVPYRFCSDEYNGSLTCKTWDEGASQAEIVQNAASMYRNYWYFSAFRRDRMGWSISSYLSRISSRYFVHATTAYQYFFYYGRYYSNQFFGQDLARAAVDGLNLLTEVIATPDTGNYCAPRADCVGATFNAGTCPSSTPIDTSAVWKNYSSTYCEGGATGTQKISMTMFNGAKPFYLGFSDDYYYYFTRSGSLYEKDEALYSLTDSDAIFYRLDTYGDRRNYSINYFRTWREPILALLNGVITNRSNEYGGTIQAGKYVPPTVIDYNSSGTGLMPTVTAPRIAARHNYTTQYNMMYYAMAALNNTLDDSLDVSHYMRVSLKGTSDDIIYDNLPANRLIELTDPRTNTTYRAAQTDDGRSIAFTLLKEAKDYMDGTFTAARSAYIATPTNPTAIANWQNAQANLSSRLETVDDLRLFYDVFTSGQQ